MDNRYLQLRELMHQHSLTYKDVATITLSSPRTVGSWLMHPVNPNARKMPDLKWRTLQEHVAKKTPV